jgi:hypothetical protein
MFPHVFMIPLDDEGNSMIFFGMILFISILGSILPSNVVSLTYRFAQFQFFLSIWSSPTILACIQVF